MTFFNEKFLRIKQLAFAQKKITLSSRIIMLLCYKRDIIQSMKVFIQSS